jgi:hypothetical protein
VAKPFNSRILMARLKGGQRVIELKELVENERRTVRSQVAELGLLTRKLRTAALTDVLTELAQPALRDEASRAGVWIRRAQRAAPVGDHDRHRTISSASTTSTATTSATWCSRRRQHSCGAPRRLGEEPSRLGGEEFVVICSNTGLEQARSCAERLRAAIEANHVHGGGLRRPHHGQPGRRRARPVDEDLRCAAQRPPTKRSTWPRNAVATRCAAATERNPPLGRLKVGLGPTSA